MKRWGVVSAVIATSGCGDCELAGVAARPTDNALRWEVTADAWCDADRVEVTDGVDARSFAVVDGVAAIWGLRAETGYTWTVGEAGGAFTTDALPEGFPTASPLAGTSEVASDAPYVLVNLDNPDHDELLIVFDAEGRAVWYEGTTAIFDGYAWDAARSEVLALVGHGELVAIGLDGARANGLDVFAGAPSHEIVPDGELWWLPATRSFEHDGAAWLEDGFAVYDRATGAEVATWFVRDGGLDPATDPPEEPPRASGEYWEGQFDVDTIDWTHINSVAPGEVDGRAKAWVSLRNLHQIVQVDVETGAIDWRLGDNGRGGAGSAGDFALAGGAWFRNQHHVTWLGGGRLLVYDNGVSGAPTRAIEIAVDAQAGTATIGPQWDFSAFVDATWDGHCGTSRGSAFRTPAGNTVVACGSQGFVAEFDPDGAVVHGWRFGCEVAAQCVVYRGVPIGGI